MSDDKFLLVNSSVLPPVFSAVIVAKDLLQSGKASSASQAAKLAGISRSAFYKYKDFVFKYTGTGNTVNINAKLADKAGIFSAFTAALYKYGANITTISQDTPVEGTAFVSLSIEKSSLEKTMEETQELLENVDGVIWVKITDGGIK